MNAPDGLFLPDEQSRADKRNIAIQRVGVRAIKHPIIVETLEGPQPSVATIDMSVFLPGDVKGTHMSRFLEILQTQESALTPAGIKQMMHDMLQRLDSNAGTITMKFPYFVRKVAPVSRVDSLLVTDGIAVEELIRMAEESASCELWGLLKRPDEKYVTERAYDNPKFVEDLVRDVAMRLRASKKVLAYRIESENFESIHNHSAVAWIEEDKRIKN